MKETKLSTESYKGVRDFYPHDMAIQRYIFDAWAKTAESFGFERYDASVLEPSELYRSKTSDEIVSEQTYTFIDRGEREVTLRPEMTPTVARMVAGRRRELTFPLRWYSIPNLFRYERPQRGRVREHWQLNVDIFGSKSEVADIEVISLAHALFLQLGATESDFVIKINNRVLLRDSLTKAGVSEEKLRAFMGLLDRKDKLDAIAFKKSALEIVDEETFENYSLGRDAYREELANNNPVLAGLKALGITNIETDPDLIRGFDYYTGTIFEFFDSDKDNRRSLLGGGRYDNLTGLFGGDPIPAIGFGMGDVTMRDFLETHNLLPQELTHIDLAIIPQKPELVLEAEKIAHQFREKNLRVYTSLRDQKVGDHIKDALKRNTHHILVVGDEEMKTKTFTLKKLSDSSETTGSIEDLVSKLG